MKYSAQKIDESNSKVWYTEGDCGSLIALTDTYEKAHFLATAANHFSAIEETSKPKRISAIEVLQMHMAQNLYLKDLNKDQQNWIAMAMEEYASRSVVEELQEYDPHEVSKVKCDICGHVWIAVRPEGVDKLECPKCGQVGNFEAEALP